MPGISGLDVLREIRSDPRLRELPVIFVSVSTNLPALDGEWTVAKPIDRNRLIDVLEGAIQAHRSRVLVVAPDRVRPELAPMLAELGIEHRWVSTAEEAAHVGSQELFEVALLHASVSNAPAVLQGVVLRGRRRGRSVIIFSTDGEWQTRGAAVGMPVFPLPQAVSALRSALGDDRTGQAR
jgi:DNA-binding response OmpR family regulator